MYQVRYVLAALALFCCSQLSFANDLDNAPPSFTYQGKRAVPIDIKTVDIDYVYDVDAERATAEATVVFRTEEDGYPMFDLVATITAAELDGKDIGASKILTIRDPANVTKMRLINQSVKADRSHTLKISYRMNNDELSFGRDYVRVGFFMSDLTGGGRDFFEQYGPSNIEYDQIKWSFNVNIKGTSREHVVYTNGDKTVTGPNQWKINFPDYFTASSIYFHLVEKGRFKENFFVFEGVEQNIPVTVYASSSSNVSNATRQTKTIMKELESTYGRYFHDKLVIYVTPGGGGMEYCGATMTSMWALGHELTHSWFARGVMPANGNAGWIDEAIASWRDNGYPRANGAPNRPAVNLGGFASYRRHTTMDAYSKGAQLISEFDYLYRNQGGMKPILKRLFDEKGGKTITVGFFQDYLKQIGDLDVDSIFNRYVYGISDLTELPQISFYDNNEGTFVNKHPRPYTKEELRKYL